MSIASALTDIKAAINATAGTVTGPAGPTGPTGPTGGTGGIGPTGQGFNNRVGWTGPGTVYAVFDFVTVGTAPNKVGYICVVPHTSGSSFSAGSNWILAAAEGPAGMAVMVWASTQYVKASDGSTGRPSSGGNPGGTVFYIGPSQPTDAVTNDPWFNYSAT